MAGSEEAEELYLWTDSEESNDLIVDDEGYLLLCKNCPCDDQPVTCTVEIKVPEKLHLWGPPGDFEISIHIKRRLDYTEEQWTALAASTPTVTDIFPSESYDLVRQLFRFDRVEIIPGDIPEGERTTSTYVSAYDITVCQHSYFQDFPQESLVRVNTSPGAVGYDDGNGNILSGMPVSYTDGNPVSWTITRDINRPYVEYHATIQKSIYAIEQSWVTATNNNIFRVVELKDVVWLYGARCMAMGDYSDNIKFMGGTNATTTYSNGSQTYRYYGRNSTSGNSTYIAYYGYKPGWALHRIYLYLDVLPKNKRFKYQVSRGWCSTPYIQSGYAFGQAGFMSTEQLGSLPTTIGAEEWLVPYPPYAITTAEDIASLDHGGIYDTYFGLLNLYQYDNSHGFDGSIRTLVRRSFNWHLETESQTINVGEEVSFSIHIDEDIILTRLQSNIIKIIIAPRDTELPYTYFYDITDLDASTLLSNRYDFYIAKIDSIQNNIISGRFLIYTRESTVSLLLALNPSPIADPNKATAYWKVGLFNIRQQFSLITNTNQTFNPFGQILNLSIELDYSRTQWPNPVCIAACSSLDALKNYILNSLGLYCGQLVETGTNINEFGYPSISVSSFCSWTSGSGMSSSPRKCLVADGSFQNAYTEGSSTTLGYYGWWNPDGLRLGAKPAGLLVFSIDITLPNGVSLGNGTLPSTIEECLSLAETAKASIQISYLPFIYISGGILCWTDNNPQGIQNGDICYVSVIQNSTDDASSFTGWEGFNTTTKAVRFDLDYTAHIRKTRSTCTGYVSSRNASVEFKVLDVEVYYTGYNDILIQNPGVFYNAFIYTPRTGQRITSHPSCRDASYDPDRPWLWHYADNIEKGNSINFCGGLYSDCVHGQGDDVDPSLQNDTDNPYADRINLDITCPSLFHVYGDPGTLRIEAYVQDVTFVISPSMFTLTGLTAFTDALDNPIDITDASKWTLNGNRAVYVTTIMAKTNATAGIALLEITAKIGPQDASKDNRKQRELEIIDTIEGTLTASAINNMPIASGVPCRLTWELTNSGGLTISNRFDTSNSTIFALSETVDSVITATGTLYEAQVTLPSGWYGDLYIYAYAVQRNNKTIGTAQLSLEYASATVSCELSPQSYHTFGGSGFLTISITQFIAYDGTIDFNPSNISITTSNESLSYLFEATDGTAVLSFVRSTSNWTETNSDAYSKQYVCRVPIRAKACLTEPYGYSGTLTISYTNSSTVTASCGYLVLTSIDYDAAYGTATTTNDGLIIPVTIQLSSNAGQVPRLTSDRTFWSTSYRYTGSGTLVATSTDSGSNLGDSLTITGTAEGTITGTLSLVCGNTTRRLKEYTITLTAGLSVSVSFDKNRLNRCTKDTAVLTITLSAELGNLTASDAPLVELSEDVLDIKTGGRKPNFTSGWKNNGSSEIEWSEEVQVRSEASLGSLTCTASKDYKGADGTIRHTQDTASLTVYDYADQQVTLNLNKNRASENERIDFTITVTDSSTGSIMEKCAPTGLHLYVVEDNTGNTPVFNTTDTLSPGMWLKGECIGHLTVASSGSYTVYVIDDNNMYVASSSLRIV